MTTEEWTCKICQNHYKPYLVVLDNNVLSLAQELEFRREHYNQKQKIGVCEKCSKELRK